MPRAVAPSERIFTLFLELPTAEAGLLLGLLKTVHTAKLKGVPGRPPRPVAVKPTATPAPPLAAPGPPTAPGDAAAAVTGPATPVPPRSHKRKKRDGAAEGTVTPVAPGQLGIMGSDGKWIDAKDLVLHPPTPPACVVCGSPNATATTRAINGLPLGVVACDDCRAAVTRREVGVAWGMDGKLHVTDGRKAEAGADIAGPGLPPAEYQDVALPGVPVPPPVGRSEG